MASTLPLTYLLQFCASQTTTAPAGRGGNDDDLVSKSALGAIIFCVVVLIIAIIAYIVAWRAGYLDGLSCPSKCGRGGYGDLRKTPGQQWFVKKEPVAVGNIVEINSPERQPKLHTVRGVVTKDHGDGQFTIEMRRRDGATEHVVLDYDEIVLVAPASTTSLQVSPSHYLPNVAAATGYEHPMPPGPGNQEILDELKRKPSAHFFPGDANDADTSKMMMQTPSSKSVMLPNQPRAHFFPASNTKL